MSNLLEHTRRPDVSFCRNGRIHIAARVVSLLGLQRGDSINIDHRGGEYLLYKVEHSGAPGRYHARCHPTKGASRNFCAHSSLLCRALFDSLQLDVERVAYPVGEPTTLDDGTVCVPVITRLTL